MKRARKQRDTVIKQFRVNLTDSERKRKDAMIVGDYNEYLARKHFENQGYKVLKTKFYHPGEGCLLNKTGLKRECEKHDKLKLYRYIKKIGTKGLPDFLCLGFDDYLFVECKANRTGLNTEQSRIFEKLRRDGHTVRRISADVELNINHFLVRLYDKTQTNNYLI